MAKRRKIISQPLPGFFNVVAILMAIITFLAMVVSIYGNIFDQYVRDEINVDPDSNYCGYICRLFNPSSYIDFFENERKYSGDKYVDNIFLGKTKNDTKHNHLLVIDRTLSTVFLEDKKSKLDIFRNTLSESLQANRTKVSKVPSKVKSLFMTTLYRHLFYNDSWNFFRNIFYDGWNDKNRNGIFVDTIYSSEKNIYRTVSDKWVKRTENIEIVNELLLVQLSAEEYYEDKFRHETDINHIFDKITELCEDKDRKDSIIVTIVSDFCHEDEKNISRSKIEQLQAGKNKPKQINIIYLVPNDDEKREKSAKIVDKLRHCIKGTSQNYIEISTKDFYNDNFDEDVYKSFEHSLNQCFSYVKSDSVFVRFYHPRKNRDYFTAECRLIFEDPVNTCTISYPKIYWRTITPFQDDISRKEGTFIVHSEIDKDHIESVFETNKRWHTMKITDTLHLKFPLTSRIQNERFDLEIIYNNLCKRYRIQFCEYIPYPVAILGEIMIYAIFVILAIYNALLFGWIYKNKSIKRAGDTTVRAVPSTTLPAILTATVATTAATVTVTVPVATATAVTVAPNSDTLTTDAAGTERTKWYNWVMIILISVIILLGTSQLCHHCCCLVWIIILCYVVILCYVMFFRIIVKWLRQRIKSIIKTNKTS
jgi:hypothetical protein